MPLHRCRNPCISLKQGGSPCREGEQCEMVDMDCVDHHCPPLPFCVPSALAALAASEDISSSSPCPKGASPFLDPDTNDTLSCSPRARMLQCPDDYFCSEIPTLGGLDSGVCCPLVQTQDDGADWLFPPGFLVAQDRGGPEGENLLGDLTHNGGSSHPKPGQCPYLLPFQAVGGGCESNCGEDAHCPGERKCCLNSCGGSQCAPPLLLTACQHQKSILEHKAREFGLPTRRLGLFIPECDGNGDYLRIQTDGGFNWCVDSAGEEIQGTRVIYPNPPNCKS